MFGASRFTYAFLRMDSGIDFSGDDEGVVGGWVPAKGVGTQRPSGWTLVLGPLLCQQ